MCFLELWFSLSGNESKIALNYQSSRNTMVYDMIYLQNELGDPQ